MFNEKETEYSVKQGKEIPVFQSPKYIEARKKALELIESNKYDLVEGDFWILMNETKSGKMMYTGLIISHNGCLKINDKLESTSKFNPSCVTLDKEGYAGSLVYTYINAEQGLYEVGEVSASNCKNSYPYAMAFKRCFDRVVLKNCKLAYSGVYSDAEADEFQQPEIEEPTISKEQKEVLLGLFRTYSERDKNVTVEQLVNHTLQTCQIDDIELLPKKEYINILNKLKTDLGGK